MDKRLWVGIISIIILALGFSILLSGSKFQKKEKKKTYKRIVSLWSSTTEILCDLGAQDKIVAISEVEKDSPYYEILKNKPKCGGDIRNVNVEKVLSFKPDLVFAFPWGGQVDILQKSGLNVYVTKPCDIEGVMNLIMDVGRLVGKNKEAERIVSDMRTKIQEIERRLEKVKKKPLVYFESFSVGKTRSVGSLTHDLITKAGGINIAKDEPVPFPILSQEFIIQKNPDVIIVTEHGADPEEIKKRPGWENINAVRNNRVYKCYGYFTSYTPRCIEGLQQFAKWFHPDLFKE